MQLKSGASSDVLTIDPASKAARVTLYNSEGRELSAKATYAASNIFTPAATPNNLVIIEGSATKTVRVVSLYFATNNTAAGSQTYFLKKYSSAASGGTFVPTTAVSFDSAHGAATVNRVGHFTADPTPGSLVGVIATRRVASPIVVPTSFAGVREDAGFDFFGDASIAAGLMGLPEPATLRGVSQYLAVDFNDVALVAGQIHAYTIVWTEE